MIEHESFVTKMIAMGSRIWRKIFEKRQLPDPALSSLPSALRWQGVYKISKIQLVVYYQCCVLIGWATTRLYAIAY